MRPVRSTPHVCSLPGGLFVGFIRQFFTWGGRSLKAGPVVPLAEMAMRNAQDRITHRELPSLRTPP